MMRVNSSDKADGAPSAQKKKGVAMGQAAVDLPDPLEKPKPAPTTSADDLLAQLAGDEIDRLLADADAGKSPTPASSPLEPPILIESPPIVAEAAPVLEEPTPDRGDTETGNPERSALAASELAQQTMDLPDLDADVPLFLKPLVWLNSPLEMFPEQFRETLGKIAVLTLVNAIAVLAYVVLFRRHH
jgi:hypothetical protein